MFNFFDTIVSFLQTVVTFIANMILTLIYAIDFVFEGVTYAFTCIAFLPPWLLAFVTAVIAWSILTFLINRG